MIYYDLHIHSALSPCANDDMTPNNIVNMAIISGLDVISVTDHNSLKNQVSIASTARLLGLKYIYGVEVETIESVHILGYFLEETKALAFDEALEKSLNKQSFDENFYGNEIIYDDLDLVVAKLDYLLLTKANLTVNEASKLIKDYGGKVVLAHPLRKHGILRELGYVPCFDFDGYEVNIKDLEALSKIEAFKDKLALTNSDAHSLIQIKERDEGMENEKFLAFFKD